MSSAPRNPLAETLPGDRLGDITVDIGNLGKGKLSGVVSYLVTNRTIGSYWRRKKDSCSHNADSGIGTLILTLPLLPAFILTLLPYPQYRQ
ncbi:hypothetical protein SDC9_23709 [bioreactor metagenome]|uniref:Uncharacterized protein n=1 Tax=bioreactor metagenome TaxID=1076179 RepID=A0A644UG59_9ZZZZ